MFLKEVLCFFFGRILILKPWKHNEDLVQANFSTIPIWIHISNLPLRWWSGGIIGKIIRAVGNPLYMDQATAEKTMLNYTRVCVEMDASSKFLDELLIFLNDEP